MTKEELEKEVEEKAETYSEAFIEKGVAKASYAKGYLAGAEPREKRIAELEAQIEKMKCCENCDYREPYCEEAIRLPFGCCCERWKLREIKEK